jgi:ELWxxDGT repeat protein
LMSATAMLWSLRELNPPAETGEDGDVGDEGLTTLLLVQEEPAGLNCSNGGHAIMTGIDANRDGALHLDEVQKTSFICNGANSEETEVNSALTTFEVISEGNATCAMGGLLVMTGIDLDGDGNLSTAEVEASQMVCNGVNGQQGDDGNDGADGQSHDPIMSQDSRATVCPDGLRMRFGVDDGAGRALADDAVLQADEVHSLMVLCWQTDWNYTFPEFITGSASSFSNGCSQFIDFEQYLVFSAMSSLGCELWISEGTENTTSILKDINSGGESAPGLLAGLMIWRGLLWFDADDGDNGRELWYSDGTPQGTKMAADICPGACSSNPGQYGGIFGHANSVFFSADDGTGIGAELYSLDSNTLEVSLLSDICPDSCSSQAGNNGWASLGDELFFSAFDGDSTELFAYGDSLRVLTDFGDEVSKTHSLTVYENELWFDADDQINGRELWHSDGVNLTLLNLDGGFGDSLVADDFGIQILNGLMLLQSEGTLISIDSEYVVNNLNSSLGDIGGNAAPSIADGAIWFACQGPSTGVELCWSDGLTAELVHEFMTGIQNSDISSMVELGGYVYVVANGINNSAETGNELWRTSASSSPQLIFEGQIGSGSGEVGYYGGLTAVGNSLFFSFDDGSHGHELQALGWLPDDSSHLLMSDLGP